MTACKPQRSHRIALRTQSNLHQDFYEKDFQGIDAMAEKRQDSGFTVTDRRLFTEDGELRKDASEETGAPKAAAPPAPVPPPKEAAPAANPMAPVPPPPPRATQPDLPLPPHPP